MYTQVRHRIQFCSAFFSIRDYSPPTQLLHFVSFISWFRRGPLFFLPFSLETFPRNLLSTFSMVLNLRKVFRVFVFLPLYTGRSQGPSVGWTAVPVCLRVQGSVHPRPRSVSGCVASLRPPPGPRGRRDRRLDPPRCQGSRQAYDNKVVTSVLW